MFLKLRNIPPVCLLTSLLRLITGRLRYSKHYLDNSVKMKDGQEFAIFRYISSHPLNHSKTNCVFIVRFKFAHLSHKANRIVSIIPMLIIAGFPGFKSKYYAVNNNNGCWQGMYQWKSMKHLEEYKKSFIYKMMNKRVLPETLKSIEISNQILNDFIKDITVIN